MDRKNCTTFGWGAQVAVLTLFNIGLAIAALTRYSSLAALIASAATPLSLWVFGKPEETGLFAVLTVLIWIMHRTNIARLVHGTEGRIGKTLRSETL